MRYLKKLISINLLILAILLGLSSCKKEVVKVIHIRKIPDEMKAYWDFKQGSYWIYRDSVTGYVDSVYVTAYEDYMGKGTLSATGDSIVYEYLQVNTHSSLDGYDYNFWINTQAGGQGDGNVVWSSKSKVGNYVDTRTMFFYPFVKGRYTGNFIGSKFDSVYVENSYPNYINYINVVEEISTVNSFENYLLTKYFYAKNIGLVRYEVPEANKIRTLISYHINQ